MNHMIENLFGNIMTMYGVAIIYSIFVLAFRILFMLSIGFDCKAREDKRQTMWMLLCFFFPLVAGIVYSCKRSKAVPQQRQCHSCGAYVSDTVTFCPNCGTQLMMNNRNNEFEKNQKNSHITFGVSMAALAVAVVLYIVFIFSTMNLAFDGINDTFDWIEDDYNYSESFDFDDWDESEIHYGYELNGTTVYYDKNGKAYYDDDDVLYFDKDGNTYTYDNDDYAFETKNDKELPASYCYVDENGYFYFDSEGYKDDRKSTVFYSAESDCYKDDNGVKYFYAHDVSWDKDGKLVDYWGDYFIVQKGE